MTVGTGNQSMSKRVLHPVFILSIVLYLYTAAGAQPELDISFNGSGKVVTDFGHGQDVIFDVMAQADGRIIAVGTKSRGFPGSCFALTRYNPNSSIDTTFGDNGLVFTDFDANAPTEGALAAAIQPDGKVVAAGFISLLNPGPGFFALARYNTDGSLDTTFGSGGKVLTAVVQHINEARAIAIGPDGKIVVAGYYFGGNQNFQALLVRYNPDGSLDSSFGSGGTVTDFRGFSSGSANLAETVAIQPDGKIVIAGHYTSPDGGSTVATMARFNANGTYDTSFGTSGRLEIPVASGSAQFNDIEVLPDGRIVAVGRSAPNFFVVRFNSNGSSDTTFDGDGMVTTSMGGSSALATTVLVRPNGKIFVSGIATGRGFGAASYNSDGSLDTSFSGNGRLTFDFGNTASQAFGMAFDGLGRILIAGTSKDTQLGDFALARLYTLDPMPVTITGRTLTKGGQPIRNVNLALTNSLGQTLYAFTSSFGYFQFEVPTGQTYTLSVSSKRYTFETRVFGVNEAIDHLDLIGEPLVERPAGENIMLKKGKR